MREKSQNIQFQILKQINCLLQHVAISYWLRGGWALDFLLGEVTRPHADIDLICWSQDKDQIIKLLTEDEFTFGRDLGTQVDFHYSEQEISVGFISCDEPAVSLSKGFRCGAGCQMR